MKIKNALIMATGKVLGSHAYIIVGYETVNKNGYDSLFIK